MAKPTPATSLPHERVTGFILAVAFIVVFPFALAISGWSMYWVARSQGTPVFLAAGASCGTDGVALIAAALAVRALSKGRRGGKERFCFLVFLAFGVFINSRHAVLLHQQPFAQVFWAVPTLAAAAAFELLNSDTKHQARERIYRKTGHVYPGVLNWLLMPLQTLGVAMDGLWVVLPQRDKGHWWQRSESAKALKPVNPVPGMRVLALASEPERNAVTGPEAPVTGPAAADSVTSPVTGPVTGPDSPDVTGPAGPGPAAAPASSGTVPGAPSANNVTWIDSRVTGPGTGSVTGYGVTGPVTRNCAHCARPFLAATPQARFCHVNCRVAAGRARKRSGAGLCP
jgi:Protein of unknown function (DUF2637)